MKPHNPLRTCPVCSYRPDGSTDRLCFAHRRARHLEHLLARAEKAIRFYANPENYHAVSIRADRAVPFRGDYGSTNHPHYDQKPGRRARDFYDRQAGLNYNRYGPWPVDPPEQLMDRMHPSHADDCPDCSDEPCPLHEQIGQLRQALDDAVGVLSFYASPDTYFGIQLMTDSPCGAFADDLSEASGDRVEGTVPGQKARLALQDIDEQQQQWGEAHEPSRDEKQRQVRERYASLFAPSVLTGGDFYEQPIKSARTRIWDGDFLLLDPVEPTESLIEDARAIVRDVFETDDLTSVHTTDSLDEIYDRTQTAREQISDPDFSLPHIRRIAEYFGLSVDNYRADVLRLRCVPPGAHTLDEAEAAYTAHRDVWYANPSVQLNCWMPLFDVSADQAFEFFPDYFHRPIENNSDEFDYEDFDFQSDHGGIYPQPQEDIDESNTRSFAMQAAQLLVFSPNHLHRTIENKTDTTRFSLDFRLVDETGRDFTEIAKTPDDHSTGDASTDYHSLTELEQ